MILPWLLETTLVVSLLMAPAVIYLSNRLFIISKDIYSENKKWRWLFPLIVCSFYMFPFSGTLDFFLTGHIDVLKYPKPLTYWFWFGLIFVFQLVSWVIVADIIKYVSRFVTKDTEAIGRIHSQVIFILFVGIFIFTGLKIYHDTTQIITQRVELPVNDLPESLHNFTIVHISDIQGDEYTGREETARYIERVNKQNPDLVIFTGDLISYGTDFIEMVAAELGKTKSTYGTLAVVGDHDYWAGLVHSRNALQPKNISLLEDENHLVKIDSTTSLNITGVTEVYSKYSDPEVIDSLTNVAKNYPFKIMASHQVAAHLISSSLKNNFNLMLAGHTHGGQIRVPFMGMSFSASEQETKYVSGRYQEEDLTINVNNGLGFTLGQIRYNAPPMVSVITLKKK